MSFPCAFATFGDKKLRQCPAVSPTGPPAPTLVTELTVLTGVAILPFVVMMLTSYVKIVVVLSLLRNAVGVQQAPPNQVLNGIALLMTIYVMFPTGLAMYKAGEDYIGKNAPQELLSGATATYLIDIVDRTKSRCGILFKETPL